MKADETYMFVLSHGPTWEEIKAGQDNEAMMFDFRVQLYLRYENSAEYRPAWQTDNDGNSLYNITTEMEVVVEQLAREPDLMRMKLEIIRGMEQHPDPRLPGIAYLRLLRAMYKGWSLQVLYDKKTQSGIVNEIFQLMPDVQVAWNVGRGISHEQRLKLMPKELVNSRLHHRL